MQFLGVLGLPVVFLVGLLFGSFGRAGEVDEVVARIGAAMPRTRRSSPRRWPWPSAIRMPSSCSPGPVSDGFVDAAGEEIEVEADRARRIHPV